MKPVELDVFPYLKRATRRAKSDVANKLVSMFLHSLSRRLCDLWQVKIDDPAYLRKVEELLGGCCPYCKTALTKENVIVEHPDGMNRLRSGLHIPGNVLLACKRCNGEKRRDDSLRVLVLSNSGWESFLSHDGMRCNVACATCAYWREIHPVEQVRRRELGAAITRISRFRAGFPYLGEALPSLKERLPHYLGILYKDCQDFADGRIDSLLRELLESEPHLSL